MGSVAFCWRLHSPNPNSHVYILAELIGYLITKYILPEEPFKIGSWLTWDSLGISLTGPPEVNGETWISTEKPVLFKPPADELPNAFSILSQLSIV